MARLGGLGRMRRQRHLNAEVNIINLVDVMLVLLVIFMITTPIMQSAIPINLPKASAQPMQMTDAITVTVDRNGDVAIGDHRQTFAQFEATFRVLIQTQHPMAVYVRGDAAAPHGRVIEVLSIARKAGAEKFGLVVGPEQ